MYVLGIETSCDETSCAVVKERRVLSNVTISSLRMHKKYGGIIPEIATRNHLKVIDLVFQRALEEAGVSLSQIGLIGVTSRPGLVGALVIGLNFAKALSVACRKPFLGIDHLQAHLFAPFLNNRIPFLFPSIGLVVSGGHTQLVVIDGFEKISTIGETRDDAAGEVFDKVARSFGLGYPGGIYIDRISDRKLKDSFSFNVGTPGFDFSFSGVKTALIYKKMELEKKELLSRKLKVQLLSSFQESVVKAIVKNTILAAKKHKTATIICGGGVIANSRLRELLTIEARANNCKLYLPDFKFSTDNAAMVAGLAFYLYNNRKEESPLNLEACSY